MSGPVCKVCVVQDSEGLIENFMYLINKSPKTFYQKYFGPIPEKTLTEKFGPMLKQPLNAKFKGDMFRYYLETTEKDLITQIKTFMTNEEQNKVWKQVQDEYENCDDAKETLIKMIEAEIQDSRENFKNKCEEKKQKYELWNQDLYTQRVQKLTDKFQRLQNGENDIYISYQELPLKKNVKKIQLDENNIFSVTRRLSVTQESTISNIIIEEKETSVKFNDNMVLSIIIHRQNEQYVIIVEYLSRDGPIRRKIPITENVYEKFKQDLLE